MGVLGQITPSKIDEICPLAIPNQISTISMRIPSLVKIHSCLLIIRKTKKRKDGWTYGQMGGLTDDQCETIIPRHYYVAGYKKIVRVVSLVHDTPTDPSLQSYQTLSKYVYQSNGAHKDASMDGRTDRRHADHYIPEPIRRLIKSIRFSGTAAFVQKIPHIEFFQWSFFRTRKYMTLHFTRLSGNHF